MTLQRAAIERVASMRGDSASDRFPAPLTALTFSLNDRPLSGEVEKAPNDWNWGAKPTSP